MLAGLRYGDSRDDDDWIREEVAAASRLEVARGLVDRLPVTLAALKAGAVSYGHARAVVEETGHLDDDLAARVERRVLGKAAGMPVGAFRSLVACTAGKLDPATPEERHDEARRDRTVWRKAVPDGMALLGEFLPAEQVAACWNVVDEAAHRGDDDPDDDRTLEQRRADAFIDLLTGTDPTSACSDAASPPARTLRPSRSTWLSRPRRCAARPTGQQYSMMR